MPHAVVTGGGGFIGSHLAERLADSGYQVTVLDTFEAAPRENVAGLVGRATILDCDVALADTWSRVEGPIDVIFHLAGNARIGLSSERPDYDARANVMTTLTALEVARAREASLLLASSAAVYGEPAYVPTDERHPISPRSPYGQAKAAAEGYCELYRRLWGVQTQIIRIFNCYGERQRRFAVWDFASRLQEATPVFTMLGTGNQMRSLLHVSDAARAIQMVAESGVPGPVNVGGETILSVVDLLREMQSVFGISKPIAFSGESWPGDITRMVPSLERLRRLGFREEVGLREGLEGFREWFQTVRPTSAA